MTRLIYREKSSWFFGNLIRIANMLRGSNPGNPVPSFSALPGNMQLPAVPFFSHFLPINDNFFKPDAVDSATERQGREGGEENDPVIALQYIVNEIQDLVKLLRGSDSGHESRLLQAAMTEIIGRITGIQAAIASAAGDHPAQAINGESDELFQRHLSAVVLQNLGDAQLDITRLSDLMNMSRRNLFRRIRLSTGLSPAELVNEIRLRTARELLLNSDLKMYEIAERVGFRSRIVFTRNFTRLYGLSPTEFIKKHRPK